MHTLPKIAFWLQWLIVWRESRELRTRHYAELPQETQEWDTTHTAPTCLQGSGYWGLPTRRHNCVSTLQHSVEQSLLSVVILSISLTHNANEFMESVYLLWANVNVWRVAYNGYHTTRTTSRITDFTQVIKIWYNVSFCKYLQRNFLSDFYDVIYQPIWTNYV